MALCDFRTATDLPLSMLSGYWSSGTRLADSATVSGSGIEAGDLPEYMVHLLLSSPPSTLPPLSFLSFLPSDASIYALDSAVALKLALDPPTVVVDASRAQEPQELALRPIQARKRLRNEKLVVA